jgi:hypothetical protein
MEACFSAAMIDSRCSWSTQSFLPGAVFSPHMIHFERVFAPAERKTDIALFLPAKDFLIGARTVVEKRPAMSLEGIKSLDVRFMEEVL